MNRQEIRFRLRKVVRHLDGILLAQILILLLVSTAVLYSASGQSTDRLMGHLINVLVGLTVLVVVANIPPHILSKLAPPLYILGVVLLLGVAIFGEVRNGSRRWLSLGVGAIQPSELSKIALPLMLAWYFQRREGILQLKDFLLATLLVVAPLVLILREPDLGTALLIAASGLYMLFLAGLPWKIMLGLAAALGAFVPVAWNMMHDYQRQRVLTLFDPASDPLGSGYHIIQSTIAIGSGGLFGRGWMEGTQTRLDFIPERTTDFVFAVFGEEFGMLGGVLLVLLYLSMVVRGLMIASRGANLFSRLMAGAISLNLFTYVFVNMGMVSGILPVVGVPLPFISYGGTAMLTLMIGFGILMSVATHRKLLKT
jgi:rod shape determining protein RodA